MRQSQLGYKKSLDDGLTKEMKIKKKHVSGNTDKESALMYRLKTTLKLHPLAILTRILAEGCFFALEVNV